VAGVGRFLEGVLLVKAVQGALDLGLDHAPSVAVTSALVNKLPRATSTGEPRGVVYTRQWVVDLILDLAGYRAEEDLVARYAVEPAAGAGAFLVPMIRRLIASASARGIKVSGLHESIRAYELDSGAAERAMGLVTRELRDHGIGYPEASKLANSWVKVDDYLLTSPSDRRADLVVGNPPYIRYDDIPEETLDSYRRLYPTMVGRCDIYVGFIEAGLRQLTTGGTLGFICADRWMRSAYGAELRRMISSAFAVQAVIEMHDAPAFEDDVAAYPAVVMLRRASQGPAIVASAGPRAGGASGHVSLADALARLARDEPTEVPGFTATTADRWFRGTAPWPSLEPRRLALLQHLEGNFGPLEDPLTGTKIGIGVATGADGIFVTTDPGSVESDRLLPLAMTADTRSGVLRWSGHYLMNPWGRDGRLVDLDSYPKLHAFLLARKKDLQGRHIAQRNPAGWYRTIDKVNHDLTARPKLYFPDMKLRSSPVLDGGGTYPHHNLYYLTSRLWDLEVLGGLLLSRVAQLFIEAYCVKMRGGTLRFQAQYLRRIKVPDYASMSEDVRGQLRKAFRLRDAQAATTAAIEAYGIGDIARDLSC
jgi:adenine-specific DNA-methyltransferase